MPFFSFAFVGVELASAVGQYFVWVSVALGGFFEDLERVWGCGFFEYSVAYYVAAGVIQDG